MTSKRVGLPSLNALSKKEGLKPVKVQRYRAGQAPEGYVDPALESSDEEGDESTPSGRARAGAGGNTSGGFAGGERDAPKLAYQVLNVEQMTKERQMERRGQKGGATTITPEAASGDRRLARLQAIQMEVRGSHSDMRSRRGRGGSDEEEEQDEEEEEEEEEDDDEEEAALRRRKAARARAMREQGEEEEELWGQGEEEEEEEEDTRKSRSRRAGEESEGSSEYTSGSEEESSEDEMTARRKLIKPIFVPKSQRITIEQSITSDAAYELAEKARLEALEERKRESHQILKEYVALQATVEEVPDVDNLAEVDDTDGLDEEAEFEQWKLRELKRIKRDREELEAREAEKTEIERRRALTEEERVKEDMAYLAKKAKEEAAAKEGAPMEKYHHKGAFYMDTDEAILKRAPTGPTIDAVKDFKALPKIMQVRNFGRAGQTKYTTLKDQDTSQRSGWSDPVARNLVQRHRMGGLRGEDVKIATHMTGGDRRGGGRGGRGGGGGGGRGGYGHGERENANRTELGGGRSSDRFDRDKHGGGGGRDYRDRDRDRDRDSDRRRDRDRDGRDSRDRPSSSSSSSYRGRDRDRDRDRDHDDDGGSSKRRRY